MELYLISVLWLLIKLQKRGKTSIILKGTQEFSSVFKLIFWARGGPWPPSLDTALMQVVSAGHILSVHRNIEISAGELCHT